MPHDRDNQVLSPELREAIERAADELFVGRGRELVQLDAALKEALGGRGRVMLIAGEPGIGKTRLAERVAAAATKHGADVFWGRCWEGEGAPAFWPWLQLARAHLRTRGAAALAAKIGVGGPYLADVMPEVRELMPDAPPAPPLDSEQARFRLFDATTALLTSASADKPIMLVLEDLHWADKSSLLLLHFLAREIAEARLFVLATYRDVEVSAGHPLGEVLPKLRRERTVDRILLRGLPEEEVLSLLVAMRGGEVPRTFAANVARETAGNPFFIREILRHLLEEGVAVREGNRWEPLVDETEIRLPESVREVVSRRLARLGDACREMLTLASVLGIEFTFEALERASGAQAGLLALIEEAMEARVLEEVPQSIGRYRFSHALVRETLYEEMGTVERVRLHRIVAEALERLHERNCDAHLPELAHHFLESLPGGDVDKAVDYATRAGDRAVAALAHDDAVRLYRRALQALGLGGSGDERTRCELLLKLGEAQWSAGGSRDPFEPFRQAAEIADRLNDGDLSARAALGLGGPLVWIVGAERQYDFLDKALSMLEERDTPLRARVLSAIASRRFFRPVAEVHARPALEMARRLGDPSTLGFVLQRVPWAMWGPDLEPAERLALVNELIAVGEAAADQTLAAEGYLWRASHYLEIGDGVAADRDVERHLRLAETSRQPYHRWLVAIARAAKALHAGRLDEAERHTADVAVASAALWGRSADPGVLSLDWGITPAIRRTRHPVTDQELATYQALATAGNARATWQISVIWLLVGAGRFDDARRALDHLGDVSDVPHHIEWLSSMCRLGESAARIGDHERARELYEILLPYRDRLVVRMVVCLGAVARPLGIIATSLSQFAEAEQHFEASLALNERVGATLWVAYTQFDYAQMLLTRDAPGDRERALALASKALATTRVSGMTLLERSIITMLEAAGLAAGVEEAAQPSAPPSREARFVLEGDFWSITYDGQTLRLKDSKGLQYLAALIAREKEEIHSAELASGGGSGEPPQGRGDVGEILDAQARSEYRERLRDLEGELEEATRWNDAGRAARMTEEIEFLKGELSAAVGLGGRSRRAGNTGERARKAVASRIHDAIAKIRSDNPALALHFSNSIRLGTFCCYTPERKVAWVL